MAQYTLQFNGRTLDDEQQSAQLEKLLEWQPHRGGDYSWDDLGMSNLMCDLWDDVCFCPQQRAWYLWDQRWVRQPDSGWLYDRLETLLNLLDLYCKEAQYLLARSGAKDDIEVLDKYKTYLRGIRRYNPMGSIIQMYATKVRKHASQFDANPWILATPNAAYDLRSGEVTANVRQYNVTMRTSTHRPTMLDTRCQRWYDFIDEITSHDKEKAAFLQRALGYSLLGVNREECMFIAYGQRSRNGKGTLFRAIEAALGGGYFRSASPKMICEQRNGESIDYNAPQPMLASLTGARIVSLSEAQQSCRLDASAMKAMTGRDTLTTRGLYEAPFSFVPQFTLWLNTNYLPVVNDDTVFLSDRVWVIEFNEHFDESSRDKDLKDVFADPENLPTILGWLMDGCRSYMRDGLNPPECVRKATRDYRNQNDRIGRFLDECTESGGEADLIKRGELYQVYRNWCVTGDNRFKPIGSTTFYNDLARRGYRIFHRNSGWYIDFLKLKERPDSDEND